MRNQTIIKNFLQLFCVALSTVRNITMRWASLHPTVPAPQVPAQDRGSRDMPVPDSSASSCRCYGCRPIRRRHGAGSCRGSSTTVSCMRCRARHTRRFSFFHPHVTQSSNPLSAMPHGVLIRHKRISPFMPPRKASAHTRFGYRNPVHVGLLSGAETPN